MLGRLQDLTDSESGACGLVGVGVTRVYAEKRELVGIMTRVSAEPS